MHLVRIYTYDVDQDHITKDDQFKTYLHNMSALNHNENRGGCPDERSQTWILRNIHNIMHYVELYWLPHILNLNSATTRIDFGQLKITRRTCCRTLPHYIITLFAFYKLFSIKISVL